MVGYDCWRKFRSQTFDNMDRWKNRGGKSQRREEKKREDERRERVRRKKMQMREKVGKSRNTVFFQWFVAPEGRKVGSLKRRVRSHLARWEMNICTPLWREARLEFNMYETPQWRTAFWGWHVEQVQAVVAEQIPSQKLPRIQKLRLRNYVSETIYIYAIQKLEIKDSETTSRKLHIHDSETVLARLRN